MRISDWSSDVCSSDLAEADLVIGAGEHAGVADPGIQPHFDRDLALAERRDLRIVDLARAVAAQADRRAEFEIGLLPAPLADQVDLEIGAASRKGIAADPSAKIESRQRAEIGRAHG